MQVHRERVLVTGSSGLIGSAVVEAFAPFFEVIGFDRAGPPHCPPMADAIDCDLTSDASVAEALEQVRARHGTELASVIHLAAYYDFSGEPSPLYEEVTVRGSERLMRQLQASFDVEQFIFSSTMLVHEPTQPGQPINEHSPTIETWDYPNSKLRTEAVLKRIHGSIPLVLARISGIYDGGCHSIPLAHQIQRINEQHLTGRVFPGDAGHGQSFLHLDDLISAFAKMVEKRAELPPVSTFLLGEPETMSYAALQESIGHLIHGEPWSTQEIPKVVAKTGAWIEDNLPFVDDPFIKPWMIDHADDHYELDISRARQQLDWEPRFALRGVLPEMIRGLRADPLRWYYENHLRPPSSMVGAPTEQSDAS